MSAFHLIQLSTVPGFNSYQLSVISYQSRVMCLSLGLSPPPIGGRRWWRV